MRQLDELLLVYLDNHYDCADASEKAAFRAILALSDPQLNGYLLQRQKPTTEAEARVIDRILGGSPER